MPAAREEGEPAAQPISTLEDLLAWQPGSLPFEKECVASVFLPNQLVIKLHTCPENGWSVLQRHDTRDLSTKPRLLVCQDYRGGYTEDRWAEGSSDSDAYRINAWHCIDTFVYFSHHLVTIPPPGWMNAAHTNGVPVLGTFITEWNVGSDICAAAFASQASAEEVALKLAAIAECYGFEGWLINIENTLEPANVQIMLHFLRSLRELLHQRCPSAQLIWYDAVTMDGKLDWQNTLNARNRLFFEACDAIFVNYTWKEGTPLQAAAEAGPRAVDVYMGVDVFGRGTYGGGGLTCDVAINAAFDAGLSAALFAPGWVHEVIPEEDISKPYEMRQQEFWDRIDSCCSNSLVAHRRHSLPFHSDFNPGCRSPRKVDSSLDPKSTMEPPEDVGFNLSRQAVQPRWQYRVHQSSRASGAESEPGRPWSVCSCVRWSRTGDCGLCIEGELPAGECIGLGELFRLNTPISSGLRVTACLQEERCSVLLRLVLVRNGQSYTVILAPTSGESVKESDHESRAGHSNNTSSPSLQRSPEGVTSAAADHVVLARSDDVTDARANKHGQNHQAERVITISEKSNVKKRVWILTAEMVQNSTLSSVDIDIMCHSKGQPGVGESNVPVQAMLGALYISGD